MRIFTRLLSCFAKELKRFHDSAVSLYAEMFPYRATALLPEWEASLGLISAQGESVEFRRQRIMAKINSLGGQSVEYFYSLAELLGYNRHPSTTDPHVRIEELTEVGFKVGVSEIGEDGDALYDESSGNSQHTWRVYGTSVTSDLRLVGMFTSYKPAHTEVLFVDE
jgi:uncharacterized protein YmfQ (DUF2313 family)